MTTDTKIEVLGTAGIQTEMRVTKAEEQARFRAFESTVWRLDCFDCVEFDVKKSQPLLIMQSGGELWQYWFTTSEKDPLVIESLRFVSSGKWKVEDRQLILSFENLEDIAVFDISNWKSDEYISTTEFMGGIAKITKEGELSPDLKWDAPLDWPKYG